LLASLSAPLDGCAPNVSHAFLIADLRSDDPSVRQNGLRVLAKMVSEVPTGADAARAQAVEVLRNLPAWKHHDDDGRIVLPEVVRDAFFVVDAGAAKLVKAFLKKEFSSFSEKVFSRVVLLDNDLTRVQDEGLAGIRINERCRPWLHASNPVRREALLGDIQREIVDDHGGSEASAAWAGFLRSDPRRNEAEFDQAVAAVMRLDKSLNSEAFRQALTGGTGGVPAETVERARQIAGDNTKV
jgi:hypothetical protein